MSVVGSVIVLKLKVRMSSQYCVSVSQLCAKRLAELHLNVIYITAHIVRPLLTNDYLSQHNMR